MKYLHILMIVFFVGCTSNKSTNAIISLKTCKHEIALSSFADTLQIIQLMDDGNASVINEIDRVLFTDNRLFVLDRLGNKIVSFDKSGKYIASTVEYIGRGSNEYIHLSDAALDEKRRCIYVYCDTPMSILVFDYDLNLLKKEDVDFLAHEIMVDNESLLFLSSNAKKIYNYELIALNKNNLQSKPRTLLSTGETVPGLIGMGKYLCKAHNGDCYVSMPFQPYIYQISNGEIINEYYIDFKDTWYDGKTSNRVSFLEHNDDKNWSITNIVSNDSLLYFNTNNPNWFVANLEAMDCHSFSFLKNDIISYVSSHILPTQGVPDCIVYQIYPYMINAFIKNVERYGLPHNLKRNYEIARRYESENNPLIILWKFK